MSVKHDPNAWIIYAVTAAILVVVLGFRLRSMSRMRPLKLERLWVLPTIYALFGVTAFIAHPPSPIGWGLSLIGLLVGAAVGWQRGKMMQIHVDPVTHKLDQKASPAAMIFIVALIFVRQAARLAVGPNGYAGSMHISPLVVTDVLIAFAIGLFAAQRVEMYQRANRLLEAARAGR